MILDAFIALDFIMEDNLEFVNTQLATPVLTLHESVINIGHTLPNTLDISLYKQ